MAQTQTQKKVVDFKTLLALAHSRGIESVETESLVVNETFAFFKAAVTMSGGKTYTGHADATPQNVGPGMAPSFIRMAETRAVVRALRLAVNVGEVGAEELADYDHQSHTAAGTGSAVINDSGSTCAHCHAPTGRPHATKCPILAAPAPVGV
jgi:hypothetical protein